MLYLVHFLLQHFLCHLKTQYFAYVRDVFTNISLEIPVFENKGGKERKLGKNTVNLGRCLSDLFSRNPWHESTAVHLLKNQIIWVCSFLSIQNLLSFEKIEIHVNCKKHTNPGNQGEFYGSELSPRYQRYVYVWKLLSYIS